MKIIGRKLDCLNKNIPSFTEKTMQSVVIQLVAFLFVGIATVVATVDGYYLLGMPLIIQLGFKELGVGETKFPFRKARLADRDGDVSKRWYVNYYIWDVQRNCLVRKQYYDINEFNTESGRRTAGKRAVQRINGMLERGVHIDVTKTEKSIQFAAMTMVKAVRYGLELKKRKIARSSYLSYSSPINKFIEYIEDLGRDLIPVQEWKKIDSIQYIDYLLTEKKMSASPFLVIFP
ncbi:MAG: hypothetical protein HQ522_16690 [Bacteroidetes bacterium]|nr:hypothetical protein [Bacteroidota bacterium]